MQVMINYFPYPWPLTNKLRLAFHRAVLLRFAATSSNVLGSSVGVTKVTKNAMWPTFCLACLFVFVTSSLTFQVSGHRFFGVVSRVLANCGRRHGGGKTEGKWITRNKIDR